MDPITALSVAAAAVQFVNFGLEALELCRQIRDDAEGATTANKALEASTKELKDASEDLKSQLAADTSQTGRRIKKITSDCLALENDLINLLQQVRGVAGKKPLGALNATFKALKGSKKIEKLKNALKDRLTALESAINHDIRARVEQIGRQQDQQSQFVQDKFDELLENVHKQQQMATQSLQNINNRLSTITSQNTRIEQAVHSSRDTIVQNLHDAQGLVGRRFDALQTQRAKDVLIKSLWYPEHELRRTMVKPPTLRTFDWIFDEDNGPTKGSSRNVKWANFPKWLREGTSLYWISGKAASGKSTLMAHICNHPENKNNLDIWAAGKSLHVLCYFFWRPGSDLQKNVQGLLRSLLLQIISEIPEIPETLGPEFLAHADMAPVWSTKQLAAMFERALAISDGLKRCFCIFIDGLDEFEGDTEELLELIFRLHRRPNIKCCVSSRPETQLKHRLSGCATLKLEELNRDDIEIYVHEKIDAHQLSADTVDEIVRIVSSRASGVFLWVVLVTKSLIRGIESHDDTTLLLQRLDTYPRDMNELLEKMLEDVDEVHKQSLSFFFGAQMMFSGSNEPLSIALLTAARGHNPLDYNPFIRMCEETEKQIVAQSRGLLEVCSDNAYWTKSGRKLSYDTKLSEIRRQISVCIVPQQNVNRDAYMPLGTPTDRQQAYVTRHLTKPTKQVGELVMLRHRKIEWIHRCAYDFMLLHGSNCISSLSKGDADSEICQRLADASIKLFIAMPWIGPFRKVGDVDEGNNYELFSHNAFDSFESCCDELLLCMRCGEESTSAHLIELEKWIDLLGGEVLEAIQLKSAPPAIDDCESHVRGQYYKERWKTSIWTRALSCKAFQLVRSEISRIAQYTFGAVSLSEILNWISLRTPTEDNLALQLDILELLDDIFLRGLVDSQCETQDKVAPAVISSVFLDSRSSWTPCKWPLTGSVGAVEEEVMENLCGAFLQTARLLQIMDRSETARVAPLILDFARRLLPYLRLWDVCFPIPRSANSPIKLQISHRNWPLLMIKEILSPEFDSQMQDFGDAFNGRVRVCLDSQDPEQSYVTGPALSHGVTYQVVAFIQRSVTAFHEQPEFAARRDATLAILKESDGKGENHRDLALACLYSLFKWRNFSLWRHLESPSLEQRMYPRFHDDMGHSTAFPTHRSSQDRRGSWSHPEALHQENFERFAS